MNELRKLEKPVTRAAPAGVVLLFMQKFCKCFMANNLQKKPFLDYQAQIYYLKPKQLVINNEVSATTALEKVSYYDLINGYKNIFKDPAIPKDLPF